MDTINFSKSDATQLLCCVVDYVAKFRSIGMPDEYLRNTIAIMVRLNDFVKD